jgi:C-terminal processing protease CtpA/Prc
VKRRAFLGAALATAAWGARGAPASREHAADFDALWREIDAGYAYFDAASRQRWKALRGRRPPLQAAIEELRDDHVTLAGPGAPAGRRIPYELDIWPRWQGGNVTIESVRTFADADVAGLHAGQVVTRIDGMALDAAVRRQLGAGASVPDIEWALRRIVAGPRVGSQKLEVRERGEAQRVAVVDLERTKPAPSTVPPLIARRMGMAERDIGYIRVRIGAADDLAGQFAGALAHLSRPRALIVDLRESAGPGDRPTTLAILSRFAKSPSPWQVREAPGGARLTDVVQPSGDPYTSPVAVLVDRWTAGEGEALAAGLASLCRAEIVGTAMAGLRGELREVVLPASGLTLRFPSQRTFTPAGVARESVVPTIAVNLAAPAGGPGDPILYRALKLFERS